MVSTSDMFRNLYAFMKGNRVGAKRCEILSEEFEYHIFKDSGMNPYPTQPGAYDPDGEIYISDKVLQENSLFADLVAYHEKKEVDFLKERNLSQRVNRIRFPKQDFYSHFFAHWKELKAAYSLGVLKEYLNWRPTEIFTPEMCLILSNNPEKEHDSLARILYNEYSAQRERPDLLY